MASSPLLWGRSQNWKGANDRIRVGVIGIRGMGQSHIQSFNALENVEVVAICDVDENLFDERIKKHFTDSGLNKPEKYTDLRRLFENKDIDAVSIVTPNRRRLLSRTLVAAPWGVISPSL